jgi:hypothetical protein
MTDFYSVLRKSIESRDLHSPEERKKIYDKARRGMIRKLWASDPPLPEDEITRRIGLFDAAVERIEGDLDPARSGGPEAHAVPEPPMLLQPLPATSETPKTSPAKALTVTQGSSVDDAEALPALFRREDDTKRRVPALPPERLWRDDTSSAGLVDIEESLAQVSRVAKPARRLRLQLPAIPRIKLPAALPRIRIPRNERAIVQLLSAVIACLAVFIIGFGIYVFLPRSSGPAVAEGGIQISRVVSDATTAAEIPKESVKVTQSFALFDGRDPQVFYSTPDNPVRYDKDADGAFTRVSSSADAAGARAVIGPGLASRLAGQTIRVTLTARSAKEAGALNLRFAYQSGVAISHWQVAKVAPTYGEVGLIWRVPAQRTSKGDALIIEPGIPGDGSGVDIKSIRIDLIAQS